jgi:uncharacterized membrane protein YhhN
MKKSHIYFTLGIICFILAAAMYIIGGNDPKLTELRDTFAIPIPLAIILIVLGYQELEK